MNVVTFVDYVPPPRYDSIKWTRCRIEESSAQEGPWVVLETKNLADYPDPANPPVMNFTTELAALTQGWYRLTFLDATGDFAAPTDPVHNVPEEEAGYTPTVREVAAKIVSRTKDTLGNELGTFSTQTRPTFLQVQDIIQQSADEVTAAIDTDIPEGAWESVRQAIALKAAMNIERSYYAEQINSNRSPYNQLKEDYVYLMGTEKEPGFIIKAVEREAQEVETGEVGLLNRPSYSFPEPDLRYGLGRPL